MCSFSYYKPMYKTSVYNVLQHPPAFGNMTALTRLWKTFPGPFLFFQADKKKGPTPFFPTPSSTRIIMYENSHARPRKQAYLIHKSPLKRAYITTVKQILISMHINRHNSADKLSQQEYTAKDIQKHAQTENASEGIKTPYLSNRKARKSQQSYPCSCEI